MVIRLLSTLVAAWSIASPPLSAQPQLVKDINQAAPDTDRGSSPKSFTELDGMYFFTATSGRVHGTQLWVSDGTDSGTIPLTAKEPYKLPEIMGVAGEWLLFHAHTPAGRRLWRTDGTSEGTEPFLEVIPEDEELIVHMPSGDESTDGGDGRLYFVVRDADGYNQLWESDGTSSGTVQVSDFQGAFQISRMTVVGDELYFFRRGRVDGDPRQQISLWKIPADSSNPEQGVVLPAGRFGNSFPERAVATAGGILFFEYASSDEGSRVWRSDGTAVGTYSLGDDAFEGSINPDHLIATDKHVYFTNAWLQDEIWRSDGTPEGTISVNEAFPEVGTSDKVQILAATTHGVFFATQWRDEWSLWFLNDETQTVSHLPADLPLRQAIRSGALIGDLLVFAVLDDGTGPASDQIWVSDGTGDGTRRIAYEPGEGTTLVPQLQAAGRFVFWQGGTHETGAEPWISDGTPEGTGMLKEIARRNGDSDPGLMGRIGSRMLLSASDGLTSVEPWVSDGTPDGTRLLADLRPGSGFSLPGGGVTVGDVHIFSAYPETERERTLWRTDGTPEGTFELSDGSFSDPDPRYLRVFAGEAYFVQSGLGQGRELWKSDGTVEGTVLVSDMRPGPDSSNPAFLTVLGSQLFFTAENGILGRDGFYGRELWVHDEAGTRMIRNKHLAFGASSHPYGLHPVGSTLFFAADNGITGFELWKSDGTSDGTVIVRNVWPGAEGSSPQELTAIGDRLFFTANDGAHGRELWTSDGTSSGTRMVRDINPSTSPYDEYPKDLTVVGDQLYFVTDDGVHGFEWWVSDGTEEGTRLLKDISPGGLSSSLGGAMLDVEGQAVFSANSPSTGTELWISDGTPEGTKLLPEVNPGYGDSNSRLLGLFDGKVYFRAYDDQHGTELWSIQIGGEPEFEVSVTESSLNGQTGLFEQDVTIHNVGGADAPVVRVLFTGLGPGVEVRNATGRTDAGVPYIDYPQPIAAYGGAETLRVEYAASELGEVPVAEISVVVPDGATGAVDAGDEFAIEQILRMEDGSVLIEFGSVSGRGYRVQYSSDGQQWVDCPSPVVASSNRTQWIDAGPPETETSPAGAERRFYRVADSTDAE